MIGGGLDEDQESGYINPLMIDRHFQRKGSRTTYVCGCLSAYKPRMGTEYQLKNF